MIQDSFEAYEEEKLRNLVDGRCEKVIFVLFDWTQKRVLQNIYFQLLAVMEQAPVEAFFSRKASDLLNNKKNELSRTEDPTQELVSHNTKSPTFIFPETRFLNYSKKVHI